MTDDNKRYPAYGPPPVSAQWRTVPDDFQVDEIPGVEPSGEGEHVWLEIRKRNNNTEYVARQLSRLAGIKNYAVSYAGLKDKNAVTTQCFTIHLAKQTEPDWRQLESEDLQIIRHTRHNRKLRRGTLQGNRFRLVLRQLTGDYAALEKRLHQIAGNGVPNYFGEQRFGHENNNLHHAFLLLRGEITVRDRHKRGLYYSAARSFLFNRILSQRVQDGTWQNLLPGEAVQLQGSHSLFQADGDIAELEPRLRRGDIHPSAPLWGKGKILSGGEALQYEQNILAPYAELTQGLERAGLEMARRALRCPVYELSWDFPTADSLQLAFRLDTGAYASVVIGELADVDCASDEGSKDSSGTRKENRHRR